MNQNVMRYTVMGLLLVGVGCTNQIRTTLKQFENLPSAVTAVQPTATPAPPITDDVDVLEAMVADALLERSLVVELLELSVHYDTWDDGYTIWLVGCHPRITLEQAEAIHAEISAIIPPIDSLAINLYNREDMRQHVYWLSSNGFKWSTSVFTSSDNPCVP